MRRTRSNHLLLLMLMELLVQATVMRSAVLKPIANWLNKLLS